MGLFDRLLGSRSDAVKVSGQSATSSAAEKKDDFFLDAEASSSLGDVNFMRRSNTIRHTFPGTLDSPGGKEMVAEVASMEATLKNATPGLGGTQQSEQEVSLTGGVPKAVKKTFAQPMSQAELDARKKGSAFAVNAQTAAAPAARKVKSEESSDQPSITRQGGKPGDINPFKAMAKDLNS
jgi:hypothetical protein